MHLLRVVYSFARRFQLKVHCPLVIREREKLCHVLGTTQIEPKLDKKHSKRFVHMHMHQCILCVLRTSEPQIRGLVSPRLRLQQKATTQRNRPTWARKRPLKGHKNGCEEGAGRRASVPWVSGPRRHPEIQKITRTTTIGKQRSPRAGRKHKIISTDYDGEDRGQPMRAHIMSVTIPFSTHMKQQNVCAPEM